MQIKVIAYLGLVVFLYYIVYATYIGVIHPIPQSGDSWDYHIPIAKMLLSGEIFHPQHVIINQWYYPASGEVVNALFLLLHIPLTLTNILAILILFIVCWKTGSVFGLKYYEAIFFATTIVTLNVFVRWYNSVNIDIFLVCFFFLAVILLKKPKKSFFYFFVLGIVMGMIVGTKLTGWYYVFLLIALYGKQLLSFVSMRRVIIFFIPFVVVGLSWYIRNWILFSNPFYPLYFLRLPYTINFDKHVWDIGIKYPKDVLDAFYAEYKLWLISFPIGIWTVLKQYFNKRLRMTPIVELLVIGFFGFVILLLSPSDTKPWIMVSSLRYSYIAFIPLILVIFLIAKQAKKITLLALLSFASMVMVTSFNYYPKLVVIYSLLSVICYLILEKYKKTIKKYLG